MTRQWACAVAALTVVASCAEGPEPEPASEKARAVHQSVQGTPFLNPNQFISGYAEPEWYRDNIPSFEASDREIQDV